MCMGPKTGCASESSGNLLKCRFPGPPQIITPDGRAWRICFWSTNYGHLEEQASRGLFTNPLQPVGIRSHPPTTCIHSAVPEALLPRPYPIPWSAPPSFPHKGRGVHGTSRPDPASLPSAGQSVAPCTPRSRPPLPPLPPIRQRHGRVPRPAHRGELEVL